MYIEHNATIIIDVENKCTGSHVWVFISTEDTAEDKALQFVGQKWVVENSHDHQERQLTRADVP